MVNQSKIHFSIQSINSQFLFSIFREHARRIDGIVFPIFNSPTEINEQLENIRRNFYLCTKSNWQHTITECDYYLCLFRGFRFSVQSQTTTTTAHVKHYKQHFIGFQSLINHTLIHKHCICFGFFSFFFSSMLYLNDSLICTSHDGISLSQHNM